MVRVGWVYDRTKADLIALAERYHLDATGTIDTLRARIVAHLRTGNTMEDSETSTIASPPTVVATIEDDQGTKDPPLVSFSPGKTGIPIPATDNGTPAVQYIMDRVKRWGGHFDGGKGAEDFPEQLDDLQEGYEVTPEQILRCLPGILKGTALQWFRVEKKNLPTWDLFLTAFKRRFLPRRRQHDLEKEIHQRLQGPAETAADFSDQLRLLMYRHGNISEDNQLEWVYSNLRPEYRLFIHRRDFMTLPDLIDLATDHERARKEEAARAPAKPADDKTRGGQKLAAVGEGYRREECCWRCGQRGHYRQDCRRPAKLFCSRCGTTGVSSRDCQCPGPSGNANGTGGRGTDRNVPPNQPQQNPTQTTDHTFR